MQEPHPLNTPSSEWSPAPFPLPFPLFSTPFSPFKDCCPESKSSVSLSQGPAELWDRARFKVAYVNFLISCLLRMAGVIAENKHEIQFPVPGLGLN